MYPPSKGYLPTAPRGYSYYKYYIEIEEIHRFHAIPSDKSPPLCIRNGLFLPSTCFSRFVAQKLNFVNIFLISVQIIVAAVSWFGKVKVSPLRSLPFCQNKTLILMDDP